MDGMTRHGAQRAAKRTGTGKKASPKIVERARSEGVPREEISGNLRRYLDRQFYQHAFHWMVVFNGDVYVFASKAGDLITMYSLPGNLKHRKAAKDTGKEAVDTPSDRVSQRNALEALE